MILVTLASGQKPFVFDPAQEGFTMEEAIAGGFDQVPISMVRVLGFKLDVFQIETRYIDGPKFTIHLHTDEEWIKEAVVAAIKQAFRLEEITVFWVNKNSGISY